MLYEQVEMNENLLMFLGYIGAYCHHFNVPLFYYVANVCCVPNTMYNVLQAQLVTRVKKQCSLGSG